MVLALHFRRSHGNRSAVNTAIAALALTVLCDALFTSPLLREHYRSGQLLDAGWFAGSPAAGVRALGRPARAAPTHAAAPPGARAPAAPPATPPGCAAASAGRPHARISPPPSAPWASSTTSSSGRRVDRVVLLTGCTVVLALVVRQGIMLLDNIALTQELAQKENHFRSLVQGSSDVIMIAAPTGILRYVSPAAAGVYGRDAEELVGTELASLIHPEDLGRVVHEVRRFLAAPPARGTHHPHRVPLPVRRRGELAERRVHRQPPPGRPDLQQPGRDRTGAAPGPVAAQRRARPAHRPAQPRAVHRAGPPGARRPPRRRPAAPPCSSSTSTASRPSTTASATRRATSCWSRPPAGSRTSVRAGDTAARLGGDEFAALIVGDGTRDRAAREYQVQEIADRLRLTLSQPYRIDGNEVRVAASIGVAFAEPGIGAGDLHAQRRPRDVPRQGGRQGPRRAVRPADAGRRRAPRRAGRPAAHRPARRRVRAAAPARGRPGQRPDHRRRRPGALALRPGHPLHPRRVPARRRGQRPHRRAGPLAAGGGRGAGRRARPGRPPRARRRPAVRPPAAATGRCRSARSRRC